MTKLEALTLMNDDALQVVDFCLIGAIDAQLFGKWDPIIKFLLLKCLRIYSESL